MRLEIKLTFVAFLISASFQLLLAQNTITTTISEERIRSDIYTLASDSMAGRQSPSIGQKMASKYIAKQMYDAGLKPVLAGENLFYQKIPLEKIEKGVTRIQIAGKWYSSGVHFSYISSKPKLDSLILPIKVIGYTKSDLIAKAASDTALHLFDSSIDSAINRASCIAKKTNAKIFIVSIPRMDSVESQRLIYKELFVSTERYPNSLIKSSTKQKDWFYSHLKDTSIDISIFFLPNNLYKRLYARDIKEDSKLAMKMYKRKEIYKGAINRFTLKTSFKYQKDMVYDENVIGMIEGSDLKDEFVIVCGHYDHLGRNYKDGKVYPGADDNASGVAAMLEISRMFVDSKKNGYGPRRSIIFIAFTAEEKGLNGSFYYTENPLVPLNKTVMVFNLDMVGRADVEKGEKGFLYIKPIGEYKREIVGIANKINTQIPNIDYLYHLSKIDLLKFYFGSDHYPFVRKGIPATILTINDHPDYHKVTDTPEKINYSNLVNIIKTSFVLVEEVANDPSKFKPPLLK